MKSAFQALIVKYYNARLRILLFLFYICYDIFQLDNYHIAFTDISIFQQ